MVAVYRKYPILVKALKYLSEYNSANHLSYHGIDHLFRVFTCAVDIFEYDDELDKSKELEVYLACLFHDIGHSGGVLTDDENVDISIKEFTLFWYKNIHTLDIDFQYVLKLIECTKYPYKVPTENLDVYGKIMRDVDMSYMLDNQGIVKNYTGLRNEFKMSFEEFTNLQDNFINHLKFYSKFCINEWKTCKLLRLEELEFLRNTK